MKPSVSHGMTAAAVLLLFVCGFAAGTRAGEGYLSGLVAGRVTAAVFFFRPAAAYPFTLNRLNSVDDGDRLTGYYALLDNHIMDYGFLKERFMREHSSVVRRTILWVMAMGGEGRTISDAYDTLYDAATPSERDQMVLGLERYPDILREFAARHSIPLKPENPVPNPVEGSGR